MPNFFVFPFSKFGKSSQWFENMKYKLEHIWKWKKKSLLSSELQQQPQHFPLKKNDNNIWCKWTNRLFLTTTTTPIKKRVWHFSYPSFFLACRMRDFSYRVERERESWKALSALKSWAQGQGGMRQSLYLKLNLQRHGAYIQQFTFLFKGF